jgi:outer membrane receptor for ferrienterochelin and colicins
MTTKRCLIVAIVALSVVRTFAQQAQEPDLGGLSVEELMNVHVVSASNISERLSEAPATVIVITGDDIRQRGYTDLSQIFDDLPGMDVVRTYGDTYVKNYWRGYRNTIGDPFLIMIDGVVFNHLYFNTTDVMVTFPLSNIDRVEVVYGPASSVYGASAFMGVVNVITRQDEPEPGSPRSVNIRVGSSSERLFDATFLYKLGDVRFRLTTRIDNGNLDDSFINRYEYTSSHYYSDRRLWGGFVDNASVGGSFLSPHRNRAIDFRANAGDLELGVQYFDLNSGYGVEYAADRAQNHAVWSRPDFSAYLKMNRALSDRVRSAMMVRYRTSDVSSDSDFLESLTGTQLAPQQLDRFSFWHAANSSVSAQEDVDVKLSGSFAIRTGLRYEQKDLQKSYDITYGPSLPPSQVDGTRYPYPQPPSDTPAAPNRLTTEDTGVYLQGWYRLSDRHRLNFGVRNDHNSKYGGATTVRTGYVGTFGGVTLKALYGEAFQEPNNRLLYGGWDGSGSDPTLRPERSNTMEVNASYTMRVVSNQISVYQVRNRDTFVNTVSSAQNLGDRNIAGFDYQVQSKLSLGDDRQLKLWGYYSRILTANERKVDALGTDLGTQPVGDLAANKLHLGITALAGKRLSATLLGRVIGVRDTVASNPVPRVPGYATFDAFVRYDFPSAVGLSIGITNLANRAYFEPGVRDAGAGITPGFFDSNGLWHGSASYYNSLLPQPGRQFVVGVHFDLPHGR